MFEKKNGCFTTQSFEMLEDSDRTMSKVVSRKGFYCNIITFTLVGQLGELDLDFRYPKILKFTCLPKTHGQYYVQAKQRENFLKKQCFSR